MLNWLGRQHDRSPDNPPVWRRERLWHKAVGRSRPARTERQPGRAGFGMLTVLLALALFLLMSIGWALHDSRTVVERHKGFPWQ
jgi:hypothetical protein